METQNLNKEEVVRMMQTLDLELMFLWREFQTERYPEIRERKEKQFWDLYRIYKKQKEYLSALVSLPE